MSYREPDWGHGEQNLRQRKDEKRRRMTTDVIWTLADNKAMMAVRHGDWQMVLGDDFMHDCRT